MKPYKLIIFIIIFLTSASTIYGKHHRNNKIDCGDIGLKNEAFLKSIDPPYRDILFTTSALTLSPFLALAMLSECILDGLTSHEAQQTKFIVINQNNIIQDMARGNGPHLQTLSALMGCPPSLHHVVSNITQRNFQRLVPSADINPSNFLIRLKSAFLEDLQLSRSCTYL